MIVKAARPLSNAFDPRLHGVCTMARSLSTWRWRGPSAFYIAGSFLENRPEAFWRARTPACTHAFAHTLNLPFLGTRSVRKSGAAIVNTCEGNLSISLRAYAQTCLMETSVKESGKLNMHVGLSDMLAEGADEPEEPKVMSHIVMAYIVVADIFVTYIVVAYIVVAYIVVAYIAMAYIVVDYMVMAYVVMKSTPYRRVSLCPVLCEDMHMDLCRDVDRVLYKHVFLWKFMWTCTKAHRYVHRLALKVLKLGEQEYISAEEFQAHLQVRACVRACVQVRVCRVLGCVGISLCMRV